MSNPTSNFGWQMPTPTDLVTDLPADFEVFGQAVDTSLADLRGGTTGQILSKTTNTDMDFTWVTSAGDIEGVTAGVGISGGGTSGTVTITNDMATTITASGDIVVGTGSGTYDNLPIGTTGQVLTADTTVSPYKVKWQAPASGGKVLQVLSTTIAQGNSTTFSSATYADVTDLFVTITPTSASSKIFVIVSAQAQIGRGTTPRYGGGRINRSGTIIWASTNDGFIQLNSVAQTEELVVNTTIHYLDAPASTSALTYKLQCNMASGGGDLQISNKAPSTITVWEIGA